MIPPLVSFVTWNRMGLTARNLTALLRTEEEFELHIVDNHSGDDTWSFLETLRDSRIKSLTRFDMNRGPIYATNYNLSRRKKDQFFITVDNDVCILTPDWVSKFLTAFEVFPGLGLLGAVRGEYYDRHRITAVKRECGGLTCHILNRGFVEGCCECLHPRLMDQLGYWNEENCMGDVELCSRLLKFTGFQMGYFPSVVIDQSQWIPCSDCSAAEGCTLRSGPESCFDRYKRKYVNPQFRNRFLAKYETCLEELDKGFRSPYCPSIHDGESLQGHEYNRLRAEENFGYYIKHGNE